MNMPEIPKSKTLGFVFLGIILYIGSSYLNILKSNSSDIGMYLGLAMIIGASIAQIVNWIRYWKKN